MKILYIDHYAGSLQHGFRFRPFYLARHWVKSGHDVTVIAASYSHLRTHQPDCTEALAVEMIDGIRYCWLQTPAYTGNGRARVFNMLSFVWKLLKFRKNFANDYRPDIVIASSTYSWDIFPAYWIAKKTKAKLVFQVHDLWPLTPMELGGLSKWHPFIMALQIGENFACKKSDTVISMYPKAGPYLTDHGMDASKFNYIPNGFEFDEWASATAMLPAAHLALIEAERLRGNFVVVYAGTHGFANALEFLIEAAHHLLDAPICFVLVGNGGEKPNLELLARRLGCTNVHFLPPVPKVAIPALLNLADALFIGWRRLPLYRFGISPNKLMDYMAAGKPVIHSVEAGNDIVAEAGCGISVGAEDGAAIAAAIDQLRVTSSHLLAAMGKAGQTYVRDHLDNAVLAAQFLHAACHISPLHPATIVSEKRL